MRSKPLVCLSSDSNACEHDGRPRRLISPKAYATAVAAAGGVPLLAMEYEAERFASLCDALLLTGGDDLEPEMFGETVLNDTVSLDSERSAFETPLLAAFLAVGKPILGICRGMQFLNCSMGGDLYQDLAAQCGLCHSGEARTHGIRTEPGSVLYRLFGQECLVNSTHHQAVRKVALHFHVTAVAPDGVVEAFEHETLPIWGVQFHPECMTQGAYDGRTPDCAPLFRSFLSLIP